MNAHCYAMQKLRFRQTQNLLKCLREDHPARLEIEPLLLTADEDTDFDALYCRMFHLIGFDAEKYRTSQS